MESVEVEENGNITEWCDILDKKWEAEKVCVAAFDIDSDSYVIFPCLIEEFAELKKLAVQSGQRIDLVKNM